MTHFESYINAVCKMAHRYSNISGIEYEELEAQGYLIYCECVDKYDPSKSSFMTYLMSELRRIGDYAESLRKHNVHSSFSIDDDSKMVDFEDKKLPSCDEIIRLGKQSLSKVASDVLQYILNRSWEKQGRAKPTITNVCDDMGITRSVAKKVWKEIGDFYKTEPIFAT